MKFSDFSNALFNCKRKKITIPDFCKAFISESVDEATYASLDYAPQTWEAYHNGSRTPNELAKKIYNKIDKEAFREYLTNPSEFDQDKIESAFKDIITIKNGRDFFYSVAYLFENLMYNLACSEDCKYYRCIDSVLESIDIAKVAIKDGLCYRNDFDCADQENYLNYLYDCIRFSGKHSGYLSPAPGTSPFAFLCLNTITSEEEKLLISGDLGLRPSGLHATWNASQYNIGLLSGMHIRTGITDKNIPDIIWNSFGQLLFDCANDGFLFKDIYYVPISNEDIYPMFYHGFTKVNDNVLVLHLDKVKASVLDKRLEKLYKSKDEIAQTKNAAIAAECFTFMYGVVHELFRRPDFVKYKPYFYDNKSLGKLSDFDKETVATISYILRDVIQYSSALVPFLPDELKQQFEILATIQKSKALKESVSEYAYFTDMNPQEAETDVESINAITGLAKTWIDVGMMFLSDSCKLLPIRKYFYSKVNEKPKSQDELDIAVAAAIRFISALRDSESFIASIPDTLAVSFRKYRDEKMKSNIIKYTLSKYPFLK